jgi:hypothetical protein
MARDKDPEIAVAIRTFGNNKQNEGIRVKPGMRFAVGKPQPGMRLITLARYRELAAKKLLRPFGEEDTKATPAAAALTVSRAGLPVDQKEGVKPITSASFARPSATREAVRKRASQEKEPSAPARLSPTTKTKPGVPDGSPDGKAPRASSSAAVPASKPSPTTSPTRRGQTRT